MNSQDQQNNIPSNLSNGLGIASLVLGILGFLTAFIIIGILLDIIAIVLGIIAIVSKKQKSELGIAGLIIGTISIILVIFIGIFFFSETDTSTIETTEIRTEQSDSNTPAETVSNESEEPTNPSEAAPSNETVSQQNAVKAAKAYLDFSAFSRDGLIDQLEYEGFTTEQAVYGVEANGL